MVTLGKIDTATKEYMKDPAIFADAFTPGHSNGSFP